MKRKRGRRCTQVQCSHFTVGGCKSCENCKSKPFIINTECSRCLRCESVEDSLRWGDNSTTNQESNMNLEPPELESELEPKEKIIVIAR